MRMRFPGEDCFNLVSINYDTYVKDLPFLATLDTYLAESKDAGEKLIKKCYFSYYH
jgi:hypothetical protein